MAIAVVCAATFLAGGTALLLRIGVLSLPLNTDAERPSIGSATGIGRKAGSRDDLTAPSPIDRDNDDDIRRATLAVPTLSADDPDADGWDTEVLNVAAGKQLKMLAKAISGQQPLDESKIPDIAAREFSCPDLRPNSLEDVFHGNSFTVYRPTKSKSVGERHTRHSDLGNALKQMVAPFSQIDKKRASLKISRIQVEGEQIRTAVRVEVSGSVPRRAIQQTAAWDCTWIWEKRAEAPRLASIKLVSFEEVHAELTGGASLSDQTLAVVGANPSFTAQLLTGSQEWLARLDSSIALETFGHQGVAIGDVNGDDLEDVYVCQSGGLPNRLFVQQADGTAKDLSAEAGVDWLEPSFGALFVDLDNDGDQDLALACDDDVMILTNDGDGKFARVALLPLTRPGYSLASADYDLDGDLDIFVCVYYSTKSERGKLPHPVPFFDAVNGGRNLLWRNDGAVAGSSLRFTDATDVVGLNHNNNRWSFAAAWEDYDNDGDLDLYVANDFGRNNLYRNDAGHFSDVAADAGVEDGSFGMSVAWGDYNRDGLMDLYVSNMYSSAGNRVAYQRRFKETLADQTRERYQYLARGNSLFENAGDGTFRDVSRQSGTMMGRWAWSSRFVDINNDGWEDLLVANGWLTNTVSDDL